MVASRTKHRSPQVDQQEEKSVVEAEREYLAAGELIRRYLERRLMQTMRLWRTATERRRFGAAAGAFRIIAMLNRKRR